MLKITIVFGLVLVSIVLGAPIKKELVDIPASDAKAIIEATQGCAPKNMDLGEIFALVKEGGWKDDPEFKKLIGCAFIASGFATNDGRVTVDKAVALFDKEEAKKAITECAKDEDGPTPEDKLFNFYKCFQLKSPYTIKLQL